MQELVIIREAQPEHYIYIKDTWLKSFFLSGSRFVENLRWDVYKKCHSRLIDVLIAKSKVLIALSKDDPDVIVGYLVFEKNTLHYIYVKGAFRGYGICRLLITTAGAPENAYYSHRTGDCCWLIGSYKRELVDGRKRQVFISGKFPSLIYKPYFT